MTKEAKSMAALREELAAEPKAAPPVLCTFMLGNGMMCRKLSTAGTCQRHLLITLAMFGGTLPIGDLIHEKVGPNQ